MIYKAKLIKDGPYGYVKPIFEVEVTTTKELPDKEVNKLLAIGMIDNLKNIYSL